MMPETYLCNAYQLGDEATNYPGRLGRTSIRMEEGDMITERVELTSTMQSALESHT